MITPQIPQLAIHGCFISAMLYKNWIAPTMLRKSWSSALETSGCVLHNNQCTMEQYDARLLIAGDILQIGQICVWIGLARVTLNKNVRIKATRLAMFSAFWSIFVGINGIKMVQSLFEFQKRPMCSFKNAAETMCQKTANPSGHSMTVGIIIIQFLYILLMCAHSVDEYYLNIFGIVTLVKCLGTIYSTNLGLFHSIDQMATGCLMGLLLGTIIIITIELIMEVGLPKMVNYCNKLKTRRV